MLPASQRVPPSHWPSHGLAAWLPTSPLARVAPHLPVALPASLPLLACLQSHTVGPCSLSQVVTAETLAAWGEGGLDAHLRRCQQEYAHRAACICAAAQQASGGFGWLGSVLGWLRAWQRRGLVHFSP